VIILNHIIDINEQLEEYFPLTARQRAGFKKLGISTIRDLLWHFPSRYKNYGTNKKISGLAAGEEVSIFARVTKIKAEKTWRKKINLAEATVTDGTGNIRLVWFNQPYIAKILSGYSSYVFSGKIGLDKKGLYMANPEYEIAEEMPGKNIFSVYPETYGITSRWLQFNIQKILRLIKSGEIKIDEPIPENILKKYHLPRADRAITHIHDPIDEKKSEAARKRFAFEEIFYIQLTRTRERINRSSKPSFKLKEAVENVKEFISTLPFRLTNAQRKAIFITLKDMEKPKPMARLLEGDVGSGKTAVAAANIFSVIKQDYQTAFMAPTEVLARQHYKELIELLKKYRIKIALITSSECRKFPSKAFAGQDTHISKSQLLKWVRSGEISVVVGTHSLIQKDIKFKNLALAIVDEQHRFGINQRAAIVSRKTVPHFLSMTATPIPRTLALTIYGDLDLTILDEMPPGRKKIITTTVSPKERNKAYEKMREEIKKGRQAYVVCPRINPADPEKQKYSFSPAMDMKTVKEEAEKLSKQIFPEFSVGMLHGQMLPKEKEKVMENFRKGEIRILVATSIIEVGVNVANATIIMIEGAERFGLAQLHQLRGRVLRSNHQPYCFIFTEKSSERTKGRLKALISANNGFELAEYDLLHRGPGELTGTKQWGISDVGMDALKNIKMVEAARAEAQNLLKEDFELKKYPLLEERIRESAIIHLE